MLAKKPATTHVTSDNWADHVTRAVNHLRFEKSITEEQCASFTDLIHKSKPRDVVNRILAEGIPARAFARAIATTLHYPLFEQETVEVAHRGAGYAIGKDGTAYVTNPYDIHAIRSVAENHRGVKITAWGVLPLDVMMESGSAIELPNPNTGRKYVHALIAHCFDLGGSDVHLHPRAGEVHVKFRIDGKVRMISTISKQDYANVCGTLMTMCSLNPGEYLRPFDGRFRIEHNQRPIPVRLAGVEASIDGEKSPKFTMRLLAGNADLVELEKLGFSTTEHNNQLRMFTDGMRRPHGMIIVTGPTGSGKSTTLFAAMRWMMARAPGNTYYTLEDPVEIELPGAAQIACAAKEEQGPTFATGLKNLLRQDPDTILVGEIRDAETATLAVRAAITGHRLLSTLHANTATGAASRLRDIGVDAALMADALTMLSAQRIVPKVCPKCSEKVRWGDLRTKPHDQLCIRRLGNVSAEVYADAHGRYSGLHNYLSDDAQVRIQNPTGCDACGKRGTKGRVLVAEVLFISDAMREIIAKPTATEAEIKGQARKEGFHDMWEHAFQAIADGKLTLEHAEEALGPLPLMPVAEQHERKVSHVVPH